MCQPTMVVIFSRSAPTKFRRRRIPRKMNPIRHWTEGSEKSFFFGGTDAKAPSLEANLTGNVWPLFLECLRSRPVSFSQHCDLCSGQSVRWHSGEQYGTRQSVQRFSANLPHLFRAQSAGVISETEQQEKRQSEVPGKAIHQYLCLCEGA